MRNMVIMYGCPPPPDPTAPVNTWEVSPMNPWSPWSPAPVSPLPFVPTLPNPNPWFPGLQTQTTNPVPMIVCLKCQRLHRGDICPFCVREAFESLDTQIGKLRAGMESMVVSSEKLVRQMDVLLTVALPKQKPTKPLKVKAKKAKTKKTKKKK